jgi:hypothetical protein
MTVHGYLTPALLEAAEKAMAAHGNVSDACTAMGTSLEALAPLMMINGTYNPLFDVMARGRKIWLYRDAKPFEVLQ